MQNVLQIASKARDMVLKAKATITGNAKGARLRIYIPSDLAIDSAFPFKKGDIVMIKIDKEKMRLVVEKYEKENSE
jgi:bifunctional DNA-binding transcriptional regulator/antitoxin component of YhaV-PrlF toxin-antitoxin module